MSALAVKTFGKLKRAGDRWAIQATPAVMIRLKRFFPRVRQTRAPYVLVSDTIEVARDLEMLLTRWPMEMSDEDAAYLERRAEEHREHEEMVERILAGYIPPSGDRMQPIREPHEFQVTAAELALQSRALLLGDVLGLGKTFTALMTLADPTSLPALVVTLTDLPLQWRNEIDISFPLLKTHILRTGKIYNPAERRHLRDGGYEPDVIITSYSKLAKWRDYLTNAGLKTVIFDEIQELRRMGSDKYHAAAAIADSASLRLGLTATPIYNYGDEIYSIVNVLQDGLLGHYEEFIREWGTGGTKGRVSQPRELGYWLRDQGIFLRRTRKDVGHELSSEPERIPYTIDVTEREVDAYAADAYTIAEKILNPDTTREERFVLSGDFDWRMREATGVAKAAHVANFVKMILESEATVLLYGWHHRVYDVWRQKLREFNPLFFTGRESSPAKQRAKLEFIETGERIRETGVWLPGDPRVMVMSLRAGAGIDGLQRASNVCVFGELDWSPGIHTQCIGRLARTGQEDQVLAYFLLSDYGSDPVVADVLDVKTAQADPMIDPDAEPFEQASGQEDRIRRLAEHVVRQKRAGKLPPADGAKVLQFPARQT